MPSYSKLENEMPAESSDNPSEEQDNTGSFGRFLSHMKDSFSSLKECPAELYFNFLLKFCESYGYFSISQILVIYLHDEFGFSDIQAGTAYGLWGLCITFWGISTSWLNDSLGVRNSLLVGFSLSFFSTVIMAFTKSRNVMYFLLLFLFPLGNCMGIPMLTVGIKRYTTSINRGFAFGLFYAVMNVAAFVSGPVIDLMNIGIGSSPSLFGYPLTGNRLVILTTSLIYCCSFFVTLNFLREVKMMEESDDDDALEVEMSSFSQNERFVDRTETGSSGYQGYSAVGDSVNPIHLEHEGRMEKRKGNPQRDVSGSIVVAAAAGISAGGFIMISPHPRAHQQERESVAGSTSGTVEEYVPPSQNAYDTISELMHSKTFWRFAVLTLLLINLRTIFRHLDATLPTYLVRCFGAHYPKGIIYSINPFIIIWLTPVVAALTSTAPHFDMIKYGGFITAFSPFFMGLSTSTWAVVSFVVLLSLGEAVWSPRLYDYTMSIAPEGKEATFSALGSAPLFAAKVPVGLLSGVLISTYIPEDGSRRDGQTLWLIVGAMTLSSPILVCLLESCIREPTVKKK